MRKPFQGVFNIIRFNWHFYVIAVIGLMVLCVLALALPEFALHILVIGVAVCISLLSTLIVSYLVYDHSGFYDLDWTDDLHIQADDVVININAGFDETSAILLEKYPGIKFTAFDFYDLAKHTEVSIKRARKAYPAYPGTIPITTSEIPLDDESVDKVFLIFAAHEIRDCAERDQFFIEVRRVLKHDGVVLMAEHLRDRNNFLAYNIGFLHFHSDLTWVKCFEVAGLRIVGLKKFTSFVTIYSIGKK